MFRIPTYGHNRRPLPGWLKTYRDAVADARKEVPHGDDPAGWVGGLHRACCSWAEARAARWCAADQALLTTCVSLPAALHNAEVEVAKARHQEERSAAERCEIAMVRPDQQNPMGDSFPTWAYVGAMVLLTCLELPLVFMSFTAFGLPPIYTFLLSVLSAGITAFLGHALGTLSRHVRLNARIMLGILLGLSACFTGSLAWLREGALAVIHSDTAALNPAAAAGALFAISVASLAVASLLAWHHGVDPLDRPSHKASAVRRRWERQVERFRKRLRHAETKRRATRDIARQDVRALEAAMLSTFHRYARFNQLHRDKCDLPSCLRDETFPRLPMPAVLAQPLAWVPQETRVQEDPPYVSHDPLQYPVPGLACSPGRHIGRADTRAQSE